MEACLPTVPVVVLNGKMYEISSTLSVPFPLEVGHVSFVRRLTSKKVNGQFLIDFVTEAELGNYVSSVVFPYSVGHRSRRPTWQETIRGLPGSDPLHRFQILKAFTGADPGYMTAGTRGAPAPGG